MHRSRVSWQRILLVLMVVCLPACNIGIGGEAQTSDDPITITDALGRTVSFASPPARIGIAGRANFFLSNAVYFFPEAQERVVALTSARQTSVLDPDATPFLALLDPGYTEKVIFTPESSAEEIATAALDLVLLKRMMRETLGDPLEALGIPVVYLDLETPEQYQRDIATLGAIFGAPARARTVWAYYEMKMVRVTGALADLPEDEKPSLLLLQYNARGAEIALEVPPPGYIQTQMADMAGSDQLWLGAAQAGGWRVVNLEQIAAWNADKIVIISYFNPVEEVVARLTSDPIWRGFAAVQNNQVYGFPIDYYSWDQPDTRWIMGLTWLAGTLHPDRFTVDMEAEILEFYGELYGLDAGTVKSEIFPLLQGIAP